MYTKRVSEVMHLLMAVHIQGEEFYLDQIAGILEYYGEEDVLEAEKNLYETRAFDILVG